MKIISKYINQKENALYQTVVLFEEVEDSFFELVQKEIDKPICFITFDNCDWDKDFTPWPSDRFKGEGDKTIDLINQELQKSNLTKDIISIGYSLGGLMALYFATQNNDVKHIASCSGSLWYPSLVDYLKSKPIENRDIYLSLGNKESKTKHPLMQTVDEKTKEVKELLEVNNKVYFEYNEGNHFFEVEKRILKGLKYFLK